jgi:hypothetical protein
MPGAVVGVPFDILARRCRGTDVLTEQLRMQKPGSGFDDVEVRMSLGDAFGADINRPETYRYVAFPSGRGKSLRKARTTVLAR